MPTNKRALAKATVMFERVNSTVVFDYSCRRVRKSYHATHSVKSELETYESIAPIVEQYKSVRIPTDIMCDEKSSMLSLELVEGGTFFEWMLAQRTIKDSREYLLLLINLSVQLDLSEIYVDLDPSNVLVENKTGMLVIIDPVAKNPNIAHFTGSVLIIGVIKVAIASARPTFIFDLSCVVQELSSVYQAGSGISAACFYKSLVQYTELVISWNRKVTISNHSFRSWLSARLKIILWKAVRYYLCGCAKTNS